MNLNPKLSYNYSLKYLPLTKLIITEKNNESMKLVYVYREADLSTKKDPGTMARTES